MKKIFFLLLLCIAILFLVSCTHFVSKTIALPEAEVLEKIEFEFVNSATVQKTVEFDGEISEFLEEIAKDARDTKRESVNDQPTNIDECIRIKFYHKGSPDNPGIAYVYSDGGNKCFEQPYAGIWEISDKCYEKILNYKVEGLIDFVPMLMVRGKLYRDTGEICREVKCGVMDGQIRSQAEKTETPSINDQSNFGTGYHYQYGCEQGRINVLIDKEWHIFEECNQ